MKEYNMARSIRRAYTTDSLMTFDQAFYDSTGAFVIGELERLDQTMNKPLASVTWERDLPQRRDVSLADDTASFTNSFFAAAGGTSPNGKSWIGRETTAIESMQLDIGKTGQPLTLWGMQVGWTYPEQYAAQQLGRPVDQQKYDGLQLKYQMDVDEMAYVGDASIDQVGLLNNSSVTPVASASGVHWVTGPATAAQMIADVQAILQSAYLASAYSVVPDELRVPPAQFGALSATIVSSAGNESVLSYLKRNTICNSINGKELNIQPLKWLVGAGASGADRMIAYTRDRKYVQFPLTDLQKTPMTYQGIHMYTTLWGRLGVVEARYKETIAYVDGI